MSQKLTYKGELIGEYPTRAEALVVCFELKLVHDQHQRKLRNTLLPGVKIDGTDDIGYVGSRALEGSTIRAIDRLFPPPDPSPTLKTVKRRDRV